jgi:AhpD family alkylhydroperoxidase
MDLDALVPKQYKAMLRLDGAVADSALPPALVDLVKLRASQVNGCVYCVDLHSADARKRGESHTRLDTLVAWRESPFFSAAERAAFALTEAVTLVHDGHVPDAVWAEAGRHFAEAELADLVMQIVVINAWNRICVTTRMPPESAG